MFKHILVPQDGEVSLLTAACAARVEGGSADLLQAVTIPMNCRYGRALDISYRYGGSMDLSYGYGSEPLKEASNSQILY